jgi:hypothetical protein
MSICYEWWQSFYGSKASECERCLDKKYGKTREEWEKPYVESGLLPWKLKTPIKTKFVRKIIMFEECFEFKEIILLCYGK